VGGAVDYPPKLIPPPDWPKYMVSTPASAASWQRRSFRLFACVVAIQPIIVPADVMVENMGHEHLWAICQRLELCFRNGTALRMEQSLCPWPWEKVCDAERSPASSCDSPATYLQTTVPLVAQHDRGLRMEAPRVAQDGLRPTSNGESFVEDHQ
jgi:hypothetical protein